MRIRKEKKPQPKSVKYRKWVLIVTAILWLFVTVLAIDVLMTPEEIEDKVVDNKIQEKTNFDYKVEVFPCILYPKGGVLPSEGFIMPKITKSIKLTINTIVSSNKPVDVRGTQKVSFLFIANNLWQREYPLNQEVTFNINGIENKIIQGEYTVDIQELYSFMEKVEKETVTRPDKYYLKIKPEIKGSILYEGREIPLDTSPELTFEANYGQIKLSESDEDKGVKKNVMEFIKETSVEKISIVHQDYSLFGAKFSLISVRYIFSLLSMMLLVVMFFKLKPGLKITGQKALSETEKIHRKYRNRLIYLRGEMNTAGKSIFLLSSFKSLVNISNEKELPLMGIDNGDDKDKYFVVDGGCIYMYTADTKPVNIASSSVKTFSTVGK